MCPVHGFKPPAHTSKRDQGRVSLRALLVEDAPEGPFGLAHTIYVMDNAGVGIETADTLNRALERLSQGGIDVLLLDLDLPDEDDLGTFERAHAFAPDVPIIVLTRVEDENMALSMVKAGAQDYLVKGEVTPELLLRSIRYAVERHRLNSALRSLSLIDELTGLYNRRGFTELTQQHLKLARRTSRAILLVYVDLDDLKTINDTLGHQVGDEALIRVADLLRESFRQSDIIARIGGDEFAVMALEASEENEDQLLRRLKARAKEVNQEEDAPYQFSVSVGAARFAGGRPLRLEDLLAKVDEAMYQEKWAKKRGSLLQAEGPDHARAE
jgi:diguanylate cyclase (GGDEF)-like protein